MTSAGPPTCGFRYPNCRSTLVKLTVPFAVVAAVVRRHSGSSSGRGRRPRGTATASMPVRR
jgi:hypothetical protein